MLLVIKLKIDCFGIILYKAINSLKEEVLTSFLHTPSYTERLKSRSGSP